VSIFSFIFLSFDLRIKVVKCKNTQESRIFWIKFLPFLGQICSWNVGFDQKRMQIRFFQNLSLCIASDVKIVAKKLLEGKLCILGDTSKFCFVVHRKSCHILKKIYSQTMHPWKCQSKKCLKSKLCISCDTNKRRRRALHTYHHSPWIVTICKKLKGKLTMQTNYAPPVLFVVFRGSCQSFDRQTMHPCRCQS
jgi:hypothetical protein